MEFYAQQLLKRTPMLFSIEQSMQVSMLNPILIPGTIPSMISSVMPMLNPIVSSGLNSIVADHTTESAHDPRSGPDRWFSIILFVAMLVSHSKRRLGFYADATGTFSESHGSGATSKRNPVYRSRQLRVACARSRGGKSKGRIHGDSGSF